MIGDHHILGVVEQLAGIAIHNRVGVAGAYVNLIGNNAIPPDRNPGPGLRDRELGKLNRRCRRPFMLPWSFSEEGAAEKHMAQLQHNMWVTASRTAVLSIITGGGKWVEMDPFAAARDDRQHCGP